MSNQIDYAKINERVARRMKQRKDFQGTVLAFFIVSGITWTVYLMSDSQDPFVWPIIPTLVLAIVAVWQGLETYVLAEGREREQDRLYERELARERARLYGDADLEKPKRDQSVRLSDEGELVYDDEEDQEPERRSRAQRR